MPTPNQIRAYILRGHILGMSVTLPDALERPQKPSARIRAVHPERGAML